MADTKGTMETVEDLISKVEEVYLQRRTRIEFGQWNSLDELRTLGMCNRNGTWAEKDLVEKRTALLARTTKDWVKLTRRAFALVFMGYPEAATILFNEVLERTSH